MIKVHTADDRVLIHHLKNLLEAEGITCLVKNDQIFTLAGEVPAAECWPELWVLNDAQKDKAEHIIRESIANSGIPGNDWICPQCGEQHEPQFAVCWNCGEMQPD